MCHAVRCRTCGRFTWAGCGQHVASVRASVPADQWCSGHERPSGGLLGRLRGRGRA